MCHVSGKDMKVGWWWPFKASPWKDQLALNVQQQCFTYYNCRTYMVAYNLLSCLTVTHRVLWEDLSRRWGPSSQRSDSGECQQFNANDGLQIIDNNVFMLGYLRKYCCKKENLIGIKWEMPNPCLAQQDIFDDLLAVVFDHWIGLSIFCCPVSYFEQQVILDKQTDPKWTTFYISWCYK